MGCLNQTWRATFRPHNSATRVKLGAYTDAVDAWKNPNEDERGVDVTQIRSQLRLSVEDRVRHMVEVANVFMDIRQRVRIVGKSKDQ